MMQRHNVRKEIKPELDFGLFEDSERRYFSGLRSGEMDAGAQSSSMMPSNERGTDMVALCRHFTVLLAAHSGDLGAVVSKIGEVEKGLGEPEGGEPLRKSFDSLKEGLGDVFGPERQTASSEIADFYNRLRPHLGRDASEREKAMQTIRGMAQRMREGG